MKIIKAIDRFYKLAFRKCKNCGKESVDLGPAGICNKCLGINFGFSPHDMSEHKRLEEALMPGRQWKLKEIERQKKRDLEMQNAPKEEVIKEDIPKAKTEQMPVSGPDEFIATATIFRNEILPYLWLPGAKLDGVFRIIPPHNFIPKYFVNTVPAKDLQSIIPEISDAMLKDMLNSGLHTSFNVVSTSCWYLYCFPTSLDALSKGIIMKNNSISVPSKSLQADIFLLENATIPGLNSFDDLLAVDVPSSLVNILKLGYGTFKRAMDELRFLG